LPRPPSTEIESKNSCLGIAWGETTTRDRTIIGSQEVFAKLMNRSTHPTLLKFDVIAAVAKQSDGTLNYEKLRHVIRILRPDRDGAFYLNSCNSFNNQFSNTLAGYLSLLEFVKSVDVVRKF
jgi:hypothetical protein